MACLGWFLDGWWWIETVVVFILSPLNQTQSNTGITGGFFFVLFQRVWDRFFKEFWERVGFGWSVLGILKIVDRLVFWEVFLVKEVLG